MILIEEILISDDLQKTSFSCDLNACKGACCWEGDFGAPLESNEIATIHEIWEDIADDLSPESKIEIKRQGVAPYYEHIQKRGTALLDNGACVFLKNDLDGVSKCLFEMKFEQGLITFRKPISCHLYPIRVETNEQTGFHSINYDQWDICKPALKKGKKEDIPLYQFAEEAIIRKYGQAFYTQLKEAFEKGPA